MSEYFEIHETRNVVGMKNPINCEQANGCYLEDVPEVSKGYRPGVVLISSEWREQYFMRHRFGYGVNEYFEEAVELLKEKGIR